MTLDHELPMEWKLVADIGGTNARFGLASSAEYPLTSIEHFQVFPCADYDSIQDVVHAYLNVLPESKREAIKEACVAIAGPTESDLVEVTNLSWEFSKTAVAEEVGLSRFEVINDFSALALSCPYLGGIHKTPVSRSGPLTEDNQSADRRAVVGPGTGLGVCGLLAGDQRYTALPCEGGHVTVSPVTDEECSLYQLFRSECSHVSAEHFLSGRGIENIYRGLSILRDVEPTATKAEEIGRAALSGTSDLAHDAVATFCNLLGSFVGDTVLTLGARGGVYLGGGILPALKPLLLESDFEKRMRAKGVMSSYVADVPVELVTHPYPALIGASIFLSK